MAIFIPPYVGEEVKSKAEKTMFRRLEALNLKNAYVLHSLGLPKHKDKLYGEVDFVVVCELGVACLEIKGGRIECRDGIWYFKDRYGKEHKKNEGPFAQCTGNMFNLRMALSKNVFRGAYRKHVPMAAGVVFPDIRFESRGQEIIPEIIYDKPAPDINEYLKGIFAYWDSREHRQTEKLTLMDIKNIVQYLRGNFAFIPLLDDRLDEIDSNICRLTEQQAKTLQALSENPRLLIKGGAGSGKTLLASDFAIKCAEKGKEVLYLTYNKNLAKSLRSKLNNDNIKVTNIHKLYGDYVQIDVVEMEKDPTRYFAETLPEKFYDMVDSLLEEEREELLFDVLVVDEGQDVLRMEYLWTMDLLLKNGLKEGKWAIFYDREQNLYNKEFEAGIEELQEYPSTKYVLHENCRNTEQIGRFAEKTSGIEVGDCISGQGEEVTTIRYTGNDDYRNKLIKLFEELKKEGVKVSDVTILAPKKYERLNLCGVLDGVCKVNVMQNEDYCPTEDISFSTIQGFKGLDSKIVILTELEGIKPENYNKYMYIAISRARTKLYVFRNLDK